MSLKDLWCQGGRLEVGNIKAVVGVVLVDVVKKVRQP